jgi:hypothetical protein
MVTSRTEPSAWIEDGEKYALVGLNIKVHSDVASENIIARYSILADTEFAEGIGRTVRDR